MKFEIDPKGPNFTVQIHDIDKTFYQIQPIPAFNQIIFDLACNKQ